MLKDFILFIKYPYTAGVIATIWLGSAALLAISKDLSLMSIVFVNMITSVIIAAFGFRGSREI